MTTTLFFQIGAILLGLGFIYWGARTIFSKEYYMKEVHKWSDPEGKQKYEDLSLGTKLYDRYGWGGRWLIVGLCILALAIYSFFKL